MSRRPPPILTFVVFVLLPGLAALECLVPTTQAQASNDLFANRTILVGSASSVTASNVGASKETGEPNHAGTTGGRSLWWTWTAPIDSTAFIDTQGSSFDTVLAVYTGDSLASLTAVASNDDTSGVTSAVTFPVTAGTVYQIAVDGYGGVSGTVSLHLGIPPVNDSFANRLVVEGLTNSTSGWNVRATKEPNEPSHAENAGGSSAWWSWTAPADASMAISTAGSTFDTLLAVYVGEDIANLQAVASDHGRAGEGVSIVVFTATADVTYHFAVDGFAGAQGAIALTWQSHDQPSVLSLSDLTMVVGGAVTFSPLVAGSLPLTFQWHWNDADLPGETNASLTLSNLTADLSGRYSLTVANSYGSILSPPATLSVVSNIVAFTSTAASCLEYASGALTLSRSGFTNAITVKYSVAGSASPRRDYSPLSGTVAFGVNQTSATLNVLAIDNDVEEPPRTLTVTLVDDPGYALIDNLTATFTILDDDPNVRLAGTPLNGNATRQQPVVFTLVRSGDTSRPLTAYYSLGGTAQPGVDYQPPSGWVEFPLGQASVQVAIVALPVSQPGSQSVTLNLLTHATYFLRAPSSATGQITASGIQSFIVTPLHGAVIPLDSQLTIEAVAAFPDSVVDRVEFYDNDGLLGSSVTPPYRLVTRLNQGSHSLAAKAIGPGGLSRLSPPVQVTVTCETNLDNSLNSFPDPTPPGSTGSGDSTDPVLSADGLIAAFVTTAPDLTDSRWSGDSLGASMNIVSLHLATGGRQLLSRSQLSRGGGNADSWGPVIAANGQRVAFQSLASDLAPGDFNQVADIYVANAAGDEIQLASIALDGSSAGNQASAAPSLSADGRRVAFESLASDLVSNDTNGLADVFVRDLQQGVTYLVSRLDGGLGTPKGASDTPVLSADGRRVVFLSLATNLLTQPLSGAGDVFVHDLASTNTYWASLNVTFVFRSLSLPLRYRCVNPAISADGRFVAFKAQTTNNTRAIILRHDLESNQTDLIATNAVTTWGPSDLSGPFLSADAQVITFESTNANRVHLIAWHAATGESKLINAATDGSLPTSGLAHSPILSPNGRRVAFFSNSPILTDTGSSNTMMLYVRDLISNRTDLITDTMLADLGTPALSEDGQRILFASLSAAPGDRNRAYDIYRYDAASQVLTLASTRSPVARPSPWPSIAHLNLSSLSPDGHWLAFSSTDDRLTPGDSNDLQDCYLRNAVGGSTTLVSANTNGFPANGYSQGATPSAGGRYVAFTSTATDLDLARKDTNRVEDVYLRDMAAGTNVLVSVNLNGRSPANQSSKLPVISPDGQFVAFASSATDLVAGDVNNAEDVFLRDLLAAKTLRLPNRTTGSSSVYRALPLAVGSRTNAFYLYSTTSSTYNLIAWSADLTNGLTVGRVACRPFVSPDGRFAVYRAFGGATAEIMVFDLLARTHVNGIGAMRAPDLPADYSTWGATISTNGNRVAFVTALGLDAAQDTNGTADVYCHELSTGLTRLVSTKPEGMTGTGACSWPVISPSGRWVAFRTTSSNLLPELPPGDHLFVKDLESRFLWLVATLNPGPGSGTQLTPIFWSADEQRLHFGGRALNSGIAAYDARQGIFSFALVPICHRDQDADGMDDPWEFTHFGNLQHDGTGDTDADGMTDLQEFRAGTDPNDPRSALAFLFVSRDSAGDVLLEWAAVAGKTYAVEAKENLEDTTWIPLGNVTAGSNVGRFQNSPPGPRRFYRVHVAP